MRCWECNKNRIETRGKVYKCPKCDMQVCEKCYEAHGGNCQFCAPPFEEIDKNGKVKLRSRSRHPQPG